MRRILISQARIWLSAGIIALAVSTVAIANSSRAQQDISGVWQVTKYEFDPHGRRQGAAAQARGEEGL
jgi:hypothetical protein